MEVRFEFEGWWGLRIVFLDFVLGVGGVEWGKVGFSFGVVGWWVGFFIILVFILICVGFVFGIMDVVGVRFGGLIGWFEWVDCFECIVGSLGFVIGVKFIIGFVIFLLLDWVVLLLIILGCFGLDGKFLVWEFLMVFLFGEEFWVLVLWYWVRYVFVFVVCFLLFVNGILIFVIFVFVECGILMVVSDLSVVFFLFCVFWCWSSFLLLLLFILNIGGFDCIFEELCFFWDLWIGL